MNLSLAALLLLASSIEARLPGNYKEFTSKPDQFLEEVAQARSPDKQMRRLIRACGSVTPTKIEVDQVRRIYELINNYLKNEKKANRDELFEASIYFFGTYMDKVTPPSAAMERFKADAKTYVPQLLAHLMTRPNMKISFDKLPYNLIIAGGAEAFKTMQDEATGNPILASTHKTLWESLAAMQKTDSQTYLQICSSLKLETLQLLKQDAAKTLSPECIAQTNLGDSTTINPAIFSDTAFAAYRGPITPEIAKKLTAPQVANFGLKLPALKRCAQLPVHLLSSTASKGSNESEGISLYCLVSYMLSGNASNLDGKWNSFRKEIFKGLHTVDTEALMAQVAQQLTPADWENMNKDLMTSLLSVPLLAKHIPETMEFKKFVAITLSGADLAEVKNPYVMGMAMTSPNAPSDILAHLGREEIAAAKAKNRQGLAILDVLEVSPATKKAIIANISAEVNLAEKEHGCASVTSADEYRQIKTFREEQYRNDSCLDAMPIDLTREVLKEFPEFIFKASYQRIMEIYNIEGLKKASRAEVAGFSKGEACSYFTEAEFNAINLDGLSGVSSNCVRALLGRIPLTPDRTTRFSNEAFEGLTAAQYKAHKLSFAHFSDGQLPHLSMALTSIEKDGVLAQDKAADIITSLGSRARFFVAKQVASMSDAALSVLEASNVTAAAMVNLSPKQIALLSSRFGKFSVEQVQKIGLEHAERSEVAQVLFKHRNLFSAEGREALRARFPSLHAANSASSVVPSAIAIGAVAVAAAAFLF